MKKPIFLIMFSIFIIITLSVVKTAVSGKLSTSGVSLSRIEEEISSYKTQNLILREKLLAVSSLNNISSKAALLGFVEKKSEFVLTRPLPLAIKQ